MGYIDLQIFWSKIVVEMVQCASAHFPTPARVEQDAAHIALKRLKDECDLHIQDINYDDFVFYKNLYDHQIIGYAILLHHIVIFRVNIIF